MEAARIRPLLNAIVLRLHAEGPVSGSQVPESGVNRSQGNNCVILEVLLECQSDSGG
jgi:hypothetical protein